ncbi:MAG: sigma-54 dependent transcriptional regulator [Blastocatellia bacterium]|nr:sigma-54 dependent transcriptional regulator [Blastocatellia bacterium]
MPAFEETISRILVADDQPDVLEALRLLLKSEGFQLVAANSPQAIVTTVKNQPVDLVLMDLNYTRDTTSGREGLELLPLLRALDDTLPVVVMTAWGSVELAVEAMRQGARDFIQKPWDNQRLLAIVRTQIELGRALRKGHKLEAENQIWRDQTGTELPELIGNSPAVQPVRDLIERIGPADANVLITGENGTGKSLIARYLHRVSHRSHKPLVTVNLGGISEGLFESEFFGHVKGAFTDAKSDRIGRFEMADLGTLLLDEIANLPLSQQAKLLRVLETGEFERVGASKTQKVKVRILSATNADVRAEVAAGRFRQDLLFRLNTVELHIPPLRERREDIRLLAEHFLRRHALHYRKNLAGIEPEAARMLEAHPWPGNVRELDHTMERAVLMARESVIRVADLGLLPHQNHPHRLEELSLEEVEAVLIQKALARFQGNVSQAATLLGLSRSALYRRLQRYNI